MMIDLNIIVKDGNLNIILQKVRKVSDNLRDKNPEMAKALLAAGSEFAKTRMAISKEYEMIRGRTCGLCNRFTNDPVEVEFIDNTGMCPACDHVQVYG